MTIKLLLLKSGEDIIANVNEMVVGDEENKRIVGYFLDRPCIVKMRSPTMITEEVGEGVQRTGFEVSLFPWMPLSKDERIPIPADWMITMVEPVDKLKEMYVEDITQNGKDNKDTSSTEQSDSDITD
jgi:hypothetical protein